LLIIIKEKDLNKPKTILGHENRKPRYQICDQFSSTLIYG
jgi:hypothetical protein